jgi:Cu/Ag efflux pump CusA
MSDQAVGVNTSELWVSIDPATDYDRTVASIQQVVDGYPGLEGELLTYPKQRIDEVLTGAGGGVTVRIYGQDLNVLRGKAEEVRRLLGGIDGAVDPQVERMVEEPTLEIEVDLTRAQRFGIKPGDVRRAAATMLSGIQVGSLFEEQKVFDVVVWGAPEVRRSLTDIRQLLVDRPGGGHVRLGEVADVRVKPTLSVIRHDAVSRSIDVTADVRGRAYDAVLTDLRDGLERLRFPLEYHAEVVGDQAQRQAAERRALGIAAIAAVLVLLLLQAAFGSWRLAAAAFLTLPAALVGGVLAVLLGGGQLSLGSLVGFVLVLAVAARNSVTLVDTCRRLADRPDGPSGPELVLAAAQRRLLPILATALATALALAPLVVRGTIPGHELLQPMAVVVLGGLVTATLLNLFVTPALYLRFGSTTERRLDAAH